ncbi:hypothetical protein DEJ50_33075 [Streptomyces venezuelae]|uniref:DUF4253 domain-containing protein n=1 Tax=Streptomyces venezuelae TaxID=54571 RepID=A0A5P2DCV9_STRVZ|nr:DUF4253 domain-containing protein [Streptomyces venezuelae]QES51948.1 hypothetical protein DEJ50_33075 [Streptomyces venezuelae]
MDKHEVAELLRTVGSAVSPTMIETAIAPSGQSVLGRPVAVGDAERMWRQLLAVRDSTGWHPVLTARHPSDLVNAPSHGTDTFDARADTAPYEVVAEIKDAALSDRLEFADEEEASEWRAEFTPEQLARSINPEPRSPRPRQNFYPRWLCLVETPNGYSVPGILPGYPHTLNWSHGPGGRNMRASDHVAFLHTWYDRFGAELLYLSSRVLMVDVAQPPRDRIAVAEAAIEQYAYCPDGHDTTTYAEIQTRNGTWQFCWD